MYSPAARGSGNPLRSLFVPQFPAPGRTMQGDWQPMILDVPLVRQDAHSKDSVTAAVSMVLGFHGARALPAEMKAEVEDCCIPSAGTWVIRHGFDAEIVTMHPGLFLCGDAGMSVEAVLNRLGSLQGRRENTGSDEPILRCFIEFIRYGGRVTPAIPGLDQIRSEIALGRPLVAMLETNLLTGFEPGGCVHANAVTGTDNEFVYVNDPFRDERGGILKHRIPDFLYAMHAGSKGGLDGSSLMLIRPR